MIGFAQMQKGEKMKHEVIISQTLNDFGITLDVKAIPVIRCKDCKHYRPQYDQNDMCVYTMTSVEADDYCSYAERNEGEQE